MMTCCKQQQPPLPSQQQAKDTDRIDASKKSHKKFYSGDRLQNTVFTNTVSDNLGQGDDGQGQL